MCATRIQGVKEGAYFKDIRLVSKHGSPFAREVRAAMESVCSGKCSPVSLHDLKTVVCKLHAHSRA